MPVYLIQVPELHWATREIEAANLEEAFRRVQNGEEDSEVAVEYSHTLEPSDTIWEGSEKDTKEFFKYDGATVGPR